MHVYEKPVGMSAWLLGLVALRELLHERPAASLVNRAVAQVLADRNVRTPDMGGGATTQQVTDEVIRVIRTLNR